MPGFVDTPMIQGKSCVFWSASAGKAAKQISQAIRNKKRAVYVTKRWGLIALIYRMIPGPLYDWIFKRVVLDKY